MFTRREFFLSCSAVAGTAALAPVEVLAARSRLRDVGLHNISAEILAGLVNTDFVARDSSGISVPLRLAALEPAEIGASADVSANDPYERFSLFFIGDCAGALPQNTYSFEHAKLGRFDMFIVPVWRAEQSRRFYEAVFNRPAPGNLSRASRVHTS